MIRIQIKGTDQFLRRAELFAKKREKIDSEVGRVALDMGLRVIRISRQKYLSGPRPERLGVVTGRLRSSIRAEVRNPSKNQWELNVGTDVPYARIHEMGGAIRKQGFRAALNRITGRKGGRYYLKARPFLRPAVEEALPETRLQLQKILESIGKETHV